ncbi:MAG: hypothetical protein HC798_04540, partial [Polaribacter sp.]|nr:hypothetical protein [Polaribacter sp.]
NENWFYSSDRTIEISINQAFTVGTTINKIKALVDAPPNIKTPEYLANWAKIHQLLLTINVKLLMKNKWQHLVLMLH